LIHEVFALHDQSCLLKLFQMEPFGKKKELNKSMKINAKKKIYTFPVPTTVTLLAFSTRIQASSIPIKLDPIRTISPSRVAIINN